MSGWQSGSWPGSVEGRESSLQVNPWRLPSRDSGSWRGAGEWTGMSREQRPQQHQRTRRGRHVEADTM